MKNAKIVIIGTGPSGIAAATKLLELGFEKITLLEAENRIGGRVHTIPFADNVVDLGAQWCHGEKDNVVFELANKANLVEHSKDDLLNFDYIRSNKEVLPEIIGLRLKAIYDKITEDGETELLNYKGSFGTYLTNKFFEALKSPEYSDIDMIIAKEVLELFKKFENSLNGSDSVDELSPKGFTEYWDCEGDSSMNWKEKGYVQFLRLLMKSTEGNELGVLNQRVKLGKPVKKITWSEGGKSAIQIKCEDDEVIEADHVIVTVSLGVLKEKHMNLFDPKLPAEKVRAIEKIPFGTINKIYMEFSTPFWPSDWNGFSILWREENLREIRGTNRAWLEDITGFYPVVHQPKILCGWIVSANARHMETLSGEEILSGSMYLLRKFLEWDIPVPVNFKPTAWHTNENFRGSYSYHSMVTQEANVKPSDLASPLTNSEKKPIVLFAGEATNDHRFGTVHGAVETGWREAKRLGDFYNNKNTSE